MANKAVFVDRDHTLIEDPGYINDPSIVKLLPGVELAIKSLRQAGYKVVVVTNQSGIARGLLTEELLETIHAEMRRQLSEKGAYLDGIYYCPYHPEGTVERYAIDSDLRKPKPGMLLKAAGELDIDLPESWMVGDGPRDIEAGQRAGCRTIRIRLRPGPSTAGEEDEDVQADFTVRNLVDAARIILRFPQRSAKAPGVETSSPADTSAGSLAAIEGQPAALPSEAPSSQALPPSAAGQPAPAGAATPGGAEKPGQAQEVDDSQVRLEILRHVRQMARAGGEEFNFLKMTAGIFQVLAFIGLLLVVYMAMTDQPTERAVLWALITLILQAIALTFFSIQRPK